MGAETFRAPRAQLRERHRVGCTPAEVNHFRLFRCAVCELLFEQRQEVARMKTIAGLMAGAIEPDVTQRSPPQIGIDPIGENSLLGMAELAGAGEDAAT